MKPRRYQIEWTRKAIEMLKRVSPRPIQKEVFERASGLKKDPKRGVALQRDLAGYYSLPAGQDRYRIVYTIDADEEIVVIHAVGRRAPGKESDVYEVARRILKAKLLE